MIVCSKILCKIPFVLCFLNEDSLRIVKRQSEGETLTVRYILLNLIFNASRENNPN